MSSRRSIIDRLPFDLTQNEMTVVTSYIDLGDFAKGTGRRSRNDYWLWANSWRQLQNPVVAFIDQMDFVKNFSSIRAGLPTVIISGDFSGCWSFTLLPKIKDIYAQSDYPKHPPNTIMPMYAVAMAAKYDFVEWAIVNNPFRSQLFMWLDLGLFRTYPPDAPCFRMVKPPGFLPSKVAATEVSRFRPNTSAQKMVWENLVWVCGCVFFGEATVVRRYIGQFRATTHAMLAINVMSTDQQVIYGMFSDRSLNVSLDVELQTYRMKTRPPYGKDEWFYLGYLMRQNATCANSLRLNGTL